MQAAFPCCFGGTYPGICFSLLPGHGLPSGSVCCPQHQDYHWCHDRLAGDARAWSPECAGLSVCLHHPQGPRRPPAGPFSAPGVSCLNAGALSFTPCFLKVRACRSWEMLSGSEPVCSPALVQGPGTMGGLGSLLTSTFFPGAAAGDWARGCNPHHYYTAAWSESPGPHRDPSPTNKECETLASLTELLTNL